MKIQKVWFLKFLGVVLLVFSPSMAAQQIATMFVYPVGNENSPPTEQTGNANGFRISQHFNTRPVYVTTMNNVEGAWCNDTTVIYTTQSSCESAGFRWIYGHTGVDLSNQSCGSEIKATANGIVEFSGGYNGYGYLLIIKHTLPNGRVVYSLYGHRQSLVKNKYDVVVKGEVVGRVGNTVGADGGAGVPCHLHFAIFDQSMPLNGAIAPVGYVYNDKDGVTSGGNPIPANIIRYFYDPLLFVSDRNVEIQSTTASPGYYYLRSAARTSTTRTMYAVQNSGTVRSLQFAVDTGWMNRIIWWWNGGQSHEMGGPSIEANLLPPGYGYTIQTYIANLIFHQFLPGNNYLDARWRGDMAEFTTVNSGLGFRQAYRETYQDNVPWGDSHASLAKMEYDQVVNGVTRRATVWLSHLNVDPMYRWVCYYNPFTGVNSSWVQVY